ncbi:aromatic-amino-acid:2-oxoglutarate transaminase KNAG_0H03730 [Huiozyma naganishii CBS 8797]|uniref:Aminotransferase class I/classII large domain-containing protein n=1 Tax=Huiozyma naganishii (strain ATCC MYA-139 / BCRC 22969 / CBS 8797 / KCTC 17520 / NBRC 10181 / NCYC 3082 / Yp74L-3) TaxID=1071383 RepID=J7S222_HUIN7|nr:hypothetical protein KNAG_0H03730 [Kazachstania naganishii CBS 8797]CCK71787.1 hypothetical protein KNAG_0H03730 [Kazachstania naganishii CBS 8797]
MGKPDLSVQELEAKYGGFLSESFKKKQYVTFWEPDPKYAHLQEDDFLKSKPAAGDLIPLFLGLPSPGFFPVKSIDVKVCDHPFDSELETENSTSTYGKMTRKSPEELPLPDTLQYSATEGLDPLLNFTKSFLQRIGNTPLYNGWDTILANGSSDSLYKVFDILADRNTTVLVEEFTFVPVVGTILGTGAHIVPMKLNLDEVTSDNFNNDKQFDPNHEGIDVEYLADLLENWAVGPHKHLPKPTLMYTVVTGQNPTGVSLSYEKRRQIYALAQRHNFIIVEDDPYGYLRLPHFNRETPSENKYDGITVDGYINDMIIKSFISMDTDGRVLRLETFSKLFAPGLRLSFIAGNKYFIEKILYLADVSTRAPSSISQALVYSTLQTLSQREKMPMVDSWLHWIIQIASEYTVRRNVMLPEFYKTEAFAKGYFSVIEPSAGMFVDIKINFGSGSDVNIIEEMNKVEKYFMKNGVGIVLAYKMAVDTEFSRDKCGLIRTAISFAEKDRLIEAVRRVNVSLIEFFEKRTP